MRGLYGFSLSSRECLGESSKHACQGRWSYWRDLRDEITSLHPAIMEKKELLFLNNMAKTEIAFKVNKFAMSGGGGTRSKSKYWDASLWHNLPSLRYNFVWVFHLDYSKTSPSNLLKCKALSTILLEDPLVSNVNKCIVVSWEATTYCFCKQASVLNFRPLCSCLGSRSQATFWYCTKLRLEASF